MAVTCAPNGVVHDYVPLYFCKRSPMLYAVIYNKIADQQFIIYLKFSIDIMLQYPFVFTDSSANTIIPPNFYDNLADLDKLNWEAIDTFKWGRQHDVPGEIPKKQAKMAELLIYQRINPDSINRIIVWNKAVADDVKEIYQEQGITPPLIAIGDHNYYYVDGVLPPVTGPFFIRTNFDKTVKETLKTKGSASSPRYANLFELRDAIRLDMSCIPELAEIVGLESKNEMHPEDVGTHTLNVVAELRKLPEYEKMNKTDKLLVEIAAYFHDIGKGPKSRWKSSGGFQQVDPDHPIKSLPMVKRILTEEVGEMQDRSARIICKLVCYHDLVGDIVGKGRRIEELEEVSGSERELNMLIALGKADILSFNPVWAMQNAQKISELRDQVKEYLQSPHENEEK